MGFFGSQGFVLYSDNFEGLVFQDGEREDGE